MDIITIPKKLAQKEDLVVVPRKEYEEFTQWRKAFRAPVVKPTRAELRALERGRREMREGKYVEWSKLKRELARRRR